MTKTRQSQQKGLARSRLPMLKMLLHLLKPKNHPDPPPTPPPRLSSLSHARNGLDAPRKTDLPIGISNLQTLMAQKVDLQSSGNEDGRQVVVFEVDPVADLHMLHV